MKKYFVVSDIHSCFNPMEKALKDAGFSLTNKNHILVIAGDLFDRGNQTKQCFDFVKKLLAQKRAIWIRGNHEDLLLQLLKRNFPHQADFSNGTVKTCCALVDMDEKSVDVNKIFVDLLFENQSTTKEQDMELIDKVNQIALDNWHKVVGKCKEKKIDQFILQNTIDFVEIDKFIIVHSFIPTDAGRFFADWRTNATREQWESARWPNPFDQIDFGKFDQEAKQGKILVFGHWYNALYRWFEKHPNERFDFANPEHDHSIVKEKTFIGLDACTPISNTVNVLVIEKKTPIRVSF